MVIGASLSEPHTDELNADRVRIYVTYVLPYVSVTLYTKMAHCCVSAGSQGAPI